jgi:hypothetical protein
MKKKIETWTNRHSRPYAWWLHIKDESEGILWHPKGIMHIWLHKTDCTLNFIKDNVKYTRLIEGKVSRISAVRAANKFAKEILSGEVK